MVNLQGFDFRIYNTVDNNPHLTHFYLFAYKPISKESRLGFEVS